MELKAIKYLEYLNNIDGKVGYTVILEGEKISFQDVIAELEQIQNQFVDANKMVKSDGCGRCEFSRVEEAYCGKYIWCVLLDTSFEPDGFCSKFKAKR